MGKRVFQLFFGVLMIIFTCGMASASMMGDNISLLITTKGGLSGFPINMNANVGSGIEFTSPQIEDLFGQKWTAFCDINNSSFNIRFTESTLPYNFGNVTTEPTRPLFQFHIYGIDQIINNIELTSFVSKFTRYSGISSLTFDSHSIDVGFYSLNSNDLYSFTVNQPTATPIPAAIWIFGSGIAGLAGLRRRKKNTV